MKRLIIWIITLLVLLQTSTVWGHSGRTDKCGGHNDRKRGGYHVHNWTLWKACQEGKSTVEPKAPAVPKPSPPPPKPTVKPKKEEPKPPVRKSKKTGYTRFAERRIKVAIDGSAMKLDVDPVIKDGRTLVPVRAIAEATGAEVSWNPDTYTVVAKKGNTLVYIPVNRTEARVNGKEVPLDAPATIIDGRTMVPARFVAEAFSATVGWDAESQTVTVKTEDPKPEPGINKTVTDKVARVIDGDTVELEKLGKLRLLYVNTPETHHPTKGAEYFGPEAEAFTRSNLEGKTVTVEFDVQLRDRYRRLLGVVFLEDGINFNRLLIQEGYATVMVIPPNVKYVEDFREVQRDAREGKRGLWGD